MLRGLLVDCAGNPLLNNLGGVAFRYPREKRLIVGVGFIKWDTGTVSDSHNRTWSLAYWGLVDLVHHNSALNEMAAPELYMP